MIKYEKENIESYFFKNGYIILNEYVNTYTKVILMDNLGYKYFVSWEGYHNNKNKKLEISSKSNPFSFENLNLFINLNLPKFLILETNGFAKKNLITIKNTETGFKYRIEIRKLFNWKTNFPIYKNNPYNTENIEVWLLKNYPKLTLLKEYSGIFDKLTMIDENGYKYSVSLDNLVRRNVNQSIASSGNIFSLENIKLYILKNNIHVELLSKKFIKHSKNLEFKCLDCEKEYLCTWNNFSRDRRCPYCALFYHESKISRELKEYFLEKYSAILEYRILKSPKTDRWLPFDIFISKYKLFIEIDGVQHKYFNKRWHKDAEGFLESQWRDKIKREFAIKNGKLIIIDLIKVKSTEKAIDIIEKEIAKNEYCRTF